MDHVRCDPLARHGFTDSKPSRHSAVAILSAKHGGTDAR